MKLNTLPQYFYYKCNIIGSIFPYLFYLTLFLFITLKIFALNFFGVFVDFNLYWVIICFIPIVRVVYECLCIIIKFTEWNLYTTSWQKYFKRYTTKTIQIPCSTVMWSNYSICMVLLSIKFIFFVPVLHLMSAIFYMILFFKYIKLLHGSKIKTK